MPDDLYDRDFYDWTRQQAEVLRTYAPGSNIPADWPHLIEEIEDLGSEQLHTVESNLVQALSHLLKITAWPNSIAVDGWMDEIGTFLDTAQSRYKPSMRQKIDPRLFRRATKLARLNRQVDGLDPLPVPGSCPVPIEELLDPEVDVTDLMKRFRAFES